jgi:hypothetical protein
MNPGGDTSEAVAAVAAVPKAPATPATLPPPKAKAEKTKTGTRANLKHFGGYVNDETDEKIAVMRARLKLDNSELITLAIDELHRRHAAKRAFGDA